MVSLVYRIGLPLRVIETGACGLNSPVDFHPGVNQVPPFLRVLKYLQEIRK